MYYLLLGSAGFIGINYLSYISKLHLENIYICFDNLTYASNINELDGLLKTRQNIKFCKGDITNIQDLKECFKNYQIDVVIHFAAETHVDNSFNQQDLFFKTNVIGTENLVKVALENHISQFHFISTDEIYGMHSLEDNSLFTETDKPNPTNPYAVTKAIAESRVLSMTKDSSMKVTISRSCNNFGPYQYREKLIPLVIYKALRNESIPLYGNGLQKRDWLSVTDHCKAIDYIIQNGEDRGIYNISAHNEIENIELIKYILHRINKPLSLIEYVKDRPIHDLRYGISTEKLEKIGFNEYSNFYSEMDKCIDFYANNFNIQKINK